MAQEYSVKRMKVPEAAEHFGVTNEAIRKRIKAGTLQAEKQGKEWIVTVQVPNQQEPVQEEGSAHFWELINSLQADKEELQAEIERLRRELERKDQMMAALIERIPPQLSAPVDDHDQKPPDQSRPWWRFWG